MRKGDFDRIFDGVQKLNYHIGHVAEREFPPLVAASGRRLADGAADLQCVKQEGLLAMSFQGSGLPRTDVGSRVRNGHGMCLFVCFFLLYFFNVFVS